MKVHPNDTARAEFNTHAIEEALAVRHELWIPPGVTYHSRRIHVPPGCTLYGSGMGVSVLQQVGQPGGEAGGLLVWGDGFADAGPSGEDVEEGAVNVPMGDLGEPPPLPGTWAYVSDGRALAAELRGEFRRATTADRDNWWLGIDRPLRRGYQGVRLLTGTPAADITIRDLTVAQPEHPGAYKLLGKFAVNVTLERVRFGRPGEPGAGWGFGSCGHVTLIDCESAGAPLGFNTTHDVTIRGGRYQSIVGEEACMDGDLDGVLIVPAGAPQVGLKWYYGSERLRARNVRIEGGGALAAEGGTHSPLAVWGRECRMEGVEVVYSQHHPGISGCAFGGNWLTVEGCSFDLETWVTDGGAVTLRDSNAPIWKLLAGTRGVLRDCRGLFYHDPSDWDDHRQVAAAVPPPDLGAPGDTPEYVLRWQQRRAG